MLQFIQSQLNQNGKTQVPRQKPIQPVIQPQSVQTPTHDIQYDDQFGSFPEQEPQEIQQTQVINEFKPRLPAKNALKKSKDKRQRNILKSRFNGDFVLLSAVLLPVNQSKRKTMFKVRLTYQTSLQDQKIKRATVWFGKRDKQYFIQHHNKELLRLDSTRLKDNDIINPFSKKYWEFHILNNIEQPNITDAWKAYINNHILK